MRRAAGEGNGVRSLGSGEQVPSDAQAASVPFGGGLLLPSWNSACSHLKPLDSDTTPTGLGPSPAPLRSRFKMFQPRMCGEELVFCQLARRRKGGLPATEKAPQSTWRHNSAPPPPCCPLPPAFHHQVAEPSSLAPGRRAGRRFEDAGDRVMLLTGFPQPVVLAHVRGLWVGPRDSGGL